jgi:hypothetical protein
LIISSQAQNLEKIEWHIWGYKEIVVPSQRAVAQIILAKIIYLIYKDGKDNN